MIFNLLNRRTLHSNDWYTIFLDNIVNNITNIKYEYYTISFHNDSIGMIICNQNNEILFVNTYRYPSNQISLEILAGSIDSNENVFEAAYRECLEETGYKVVLNKQIFSFEPNNGFSDQKFHVLFGQIKDEIQYIYEKNETNEVFWLKKEEILNKIKKNEIKDGLTLVSLFIYFFNL